jgi:hypothetical protein
MFYSRDCSRKSGTNGHPSINALVITNYTVADRV